MPRDVLVTENCGQVAGDLVRWVDEAARRDQHGSSQWTSYTNDCQKLSNIGRQSERNRSVCI